MKEFWSGVIRILCSVVITYVKYSFPCTPAVCLYLWGTCYTASLHLLLFSSSAVFMLPSGWYLQNDLLWPLLPSQYPLPRRLCKCTSQKPSYRVLPRIDLGPLLRCSQILHCVFTETEVPTRCSCWWWSVAVGTKTLPMGDFGSRTPWWPCQVCLRPHGEAV